MAMTVKEVKDWLDTLPDDSAIAIDDDGLSLVSLIGDAYIEIGGIPDDEGQS